MGWLWSSTPESTSSPSSQDPKPLPPPQSLPETLTTSTASKPLSRDEVADQELQSFLQEIATDTAPKKQKYNRISRAATNNGIPTTNSDSNEPLGDQLLPTDMSCRQAFDEAFYCNSFGGRFNDLYRYGTLRSCSEHWNNFWFCMKTRSYTGQGKEDAVREHYRSRESMKYSKDLGKESSENVWKSRDKKVAWGTAFNEPFPPQYEGSDEEWRRLEIHMCTFGRR
ncbi:uncharacterized protein LY89DRAFT_778214 [Mollisia scopiformis]|uniref:Early meiotic induction protein 1 n=1 Tax=Mollisia scopiformis TaxID=149040 RepID=A0A194XNV5_MOLSC|nr:uncharacterized protein LY89DRAFT_778214 [Mollisia scopiformis]KUJ21841.1 hypothetical protein LY89DRAFT_778214 [Mollisia scopiformis]